MYLLFVDRVQRLNNFLCLSRGSALLPCVDMITDHVLNAQFTGEHFEILQCLFVSIELTGRQRKSLLCNHTP